MKKLFNNSPYFWMIVCLILTVAIFLSGCITPKKVINKVKDSAKITEALKLYFFEKYPCINDTVTKFIPGKEIIKTDTIETLLDGEKIFINDTFYIEKFKLKTVTNTITKTDTFINTVEDKRMVNYWRNTVDSCNEQSRVNDNTILVLKSEIKSNKAEKNTYKVILVGLLVLASVYGYFKLRKMNFKVPNFNK